MNMASSLEEPGEIESDPCVLLVGRHAANRLVIEALTEVVQLVPTIVEAEQLIAQLDYAVVLVDVDTDSLVAPDLATSLRRIALLSPLMLLASTPAEPGQLQAQTGALDVLFPPFDAATLRAKVRTFALLHRQKRDLARLRSLYDTDRRLTRQHLRTLTAVSAKLATCMTTDEVVQAFISEAHGAVGAVNSFVYLRKQGNERELELIAVSGVPPEALRLFQTLSLDQRLPIIAAVKSGQAVWVSDSVDLGERFPDLQPRGPVQAIVALPVMVNAVAVGAVAFSFYEPRVWDIDKREFYFTLVAAFVAALERARLLLTERNAHLDLERQSSALRLLADVGTLLSSSLD